jgi:hypothetical protein
MRKITPPLSAMRTRLYILREVDCDRICVAAVLLRVPHYWYEVAETEEADSDSFEGTLSSSAGLQV